MQNNNRAIISAAVGVAMMGAALSVSRSNTVTVRDNNPALSPRLRYSRVATYQSILLHSTAMPAERQAEHRRKMDWKRTDRELRYGIRDPADAYTRANLSRRHLDSGLTPLEHAIAKDKRAAERSQPWILVTA